MGFDKSLLQRNGEFLLLKTVRRLMTIFPETLLVTNQRRKFPDVFSQVKILEDHYLEKGPMGGLVTALECIHSEYIFLLACDIPNLDTELIRTMAAYIGRYDVIVCRQDGRLEPLFAFYRTSCKGVFQQQLKSNDWRIRKAFDQCLVKEITLKSSVVLNNVNTPEELRLWDQ